MNIENATPRPWHQLTDGEKSYAAIRGERNQTVADCGSRSDLTAQANAALIVESVNQHAALVAVVEAAIELRSLKSPESNAEASKVTDFLIDQIKLEGKLDKALESIRKEGK